VVTPHIVSGDIGVMKTTPTTSHAARVPLLQFLCETMAQRLDEEAIDNARRPTAFGVSWYSRVKRAAATRVVPLPSFRIGSNGVENPQAAASAMAANAVRTTMKTFGYMMQQPVNCV